MRWKRSLGIAGIGAGAYAVWRASQRNKGAGVTWSPQPFPYPPRAVPALPVEDAVAPAAATRRHDEPSVAPAWVQPSDGACPDGYPVKAKLASGIFHLPGGLSYERTRPDRCYRDADAAEADGLRPAQR
jgi:hypothetical protein